VGARDIAVEHVLRLDSRDLGSVPDGDQGTFPSWKLLRRLWGHPVHRMMARAGSFPPALARYFIVGYSRPGDVVLDSFCGKGTTLVEAVLTGRRALGCDVAPDAVAVTRAKTAGVGQKSIFRCLGELARESKPAYAAAQTVPDDVRIFFHPDTLAELMSVRRWLLAHCTRSRGAQFLVGCLLGILHGHASSSLSVPSAHAYAMAPAYVRRYVEKHGLTAPRRYVVECLRSKAVASLPEGETVPRGYARVYLSSAERYSFDRKEHLTDQVDLIVTSPPYLDAQTYAKDAWLRLWLLGYDFKVLRKRFIETESVQSYLERMTASLTEMLRVLKPSAHAFLVAGDAAVRRQGSRVTVQTADILAEAASRIRLGPNRFEVVCIIDDAIDAHSRYLFPVHNNGKNPVAAQPKWERILHLQKVSV
jgi:SAM-dependent methyltransferase